MVTAAEPPLPQVGALTARTLADGVGRIARPKPSVAPAPIPRGSWGDAGRLYVWMRRSMVVGLASVIACGASSTEATPAKNVAPPAVDAPDAALPSPRAAPPRATFPFSQLGETSIPEFYVVLSGRYDEARVLRLTGATFVAWTSEEQTTLARVDGTDLTDLSPVPDLFVGMHGRYPDHLYLQTQTPSRAWQVMNLARWTAGAWKHLETEASFADAGPGPTGTGWLTLVGMGDPFDPAIGARWLPNQDAAPPDVLRPKTEYLQLTTFPNGDAVGLGFEQSRDSREHQASLALETVIDGVRTATPVAAEEGDVTVLAPTSHDAYALFDHGKTLLHFDGRAWTPASLDPAVGPVLGVHVSPHGEVLLVAKRSLWMRAADGAFSPLAKATEDFDVPDERNDSAVRVDGIEEGSPWAIAGGHLVKLVEDAWTPVPLPVLPAEWSPLVPTGVAVVSPTDVWVTAKASHGTGGAREELGFVLRTRAPTKVLRAGSAWTSRKEAAYSGYSTVWREWGAREWWPAAKDDCAAPMVVFAGRAAHAAKESAKSPAAFAAARKAAIAATAKGVKLVEKAWGQETLLVARPASMAEARAIVQMYGSRGTMAGEIVCTGGGEDRPAK